MPIRSLLSAIVAIGLMTTAGCTSQQVYESGTAFRIQECQRMPDDAKRGECMALAKMPYKEYRELKKEGAR